MTEERTTEALAYLLHELDGPQRAQFEARLAKDPAAAALLRSLSDSLAAYALSESPECALGPVEKEEMMAAVTAAAAQEAKLPRIPALSRFFWPAAAALLLLLNIGQWLMHSRSPILTVDLVDGDRNGRGNRKGLVYFEPASLKKPGIVAASAGPSSPPVATSATINRSTITLSFSQTAKVRSQIQPAYAWSAFDQLRHQGFLDLHNLPAVPANFSLQLWVRTANSSRFERVGEIPAQFYGRSGSVIYKLPSVTVIPAQILITVEPRSSTPKAPGGPVVLHGP